jgi:DNA-directed RNA polymerase subunit K/omega
MTGGSEYGQATRTEFHCSPRIAKEPAFMRITTPTEVAKQAGNKYLGVLVAAKFARYLNEFPKDQLAHQGEKLTTKALQSLTDGELNYKLVRRRRSEA